MGAVPVELLGWTTPLAVNHDIVVHLEASAMMAL